MKQYPRIYSLSTVGLIHHQEFDYKFHPFRTDFTGESGSGKSMIADLIQLIFVGSEAFESATKGTDTRDPEGMVLEPTIGGKGVGYAFLNIEIAINRFLVVGVYLETGNRNSQAFIIQAGYDWQAIQLLQTPVSFQQFIKAEDILPIDLLTEWIDKQSLHIKAWQRYKEFHKILFRENIVPLDLAFNERILNDYAGILQSFSRGKTLDTQKSDSIKLFLFGDQEAKRLLENFRKAEKDMEQAVGEYGNNLREIERVTLKQHAILELRDLKMSRDRLQESWLLQALFYWFQERNRLEKDVNDYIANYSQAIQLKSILIDITEVEIDQLKSLSTNLSFQQKAAEIEYNKASSPYNDLNKIMDWLKSLGCNYSELGIRYTEYKNDQVKRNRLLPFLDALQQKNLKSEFELISNNQTSQDLKKALADKVSQLQDIINQKNRLKRISDINASDSLVNWALSEQRAFSIDEESAIFRFQDLSRSKPTKHEDYLPTPAELISALQIVEKEFEGFWINLNGIRTYVKYVEGQILNTTDEAKIRSYFEQFTSTIKNDIIELEQQLEKLQSLSELLEAFDNLSLLISAYQKKDALLKLQEIKSLDISQERFQEYQLVYEQRDSIQEEFEQAKANKNQVDSEFRRVDKLLTEYSNVLEMIDKNTSLSEEIQLIVDDFNQDYSPNYNYALEKENISGNLQRAENKTTLIKEYWQQIQPALNNINQLSSIHNSLIVSDEKLQKAKENYLSWNTELPATLASLEHVIDPTGEWEKYREAEAMYAAKYSSTINTFIDSESYIFSDTTDFVELAKTLLPEALYDSVIEEHESNVIERIAGYLTRINERNRQLNNRKIQRIKNLLDEVDETITQQENTIRRIDNFLKSGAQITGGYTARLRRTPGNNYPKAWMSTFNELVEDEQSSSNYQNRLGEKIDLAEIMKTAFLTCGGPSHTNASVAKLLNPSNYYELSFAMESESGRINKGSTGQTYAAIALLCIARLSIMSNEEGKPITPAVRVMPIDEAEGLGSNYDMLYDIASKYDYQLISLSIGPIGKFQDGEQYLYMLHKNMEVEAPINYTPIGILCETDKIPPQTIYEQ